MGRFKDGIERALENAGLADALGSFSESFTASREKAYEGIDFLALRGRVSEFREDAAGRLDELAERFARNAERRGAKVFRASSAAQAAGYIATLAVSKGVKRIAKSKSMATEEIRLNQRLQQEGISVSETDLGEWIVQLAHQRPSHMIMPAIHMKKEEVAGLFSRVTSTELEPDIPELVKVARRELRGDFLSADMGITGANFAVAETGSIVLVTNEGNARLVTTLPPIHVALVGVEKLVPEFSDLEPLLKALPRSATAQLMSSYVSVITGAVPNLDGSPKELHIVLMDSGRSEMAADPEFRHALKCLRCASCLNVCPVFALVGGHVFGSVYTGGIGTVLTAWFEGLKQSSEIQGLCIQCGRCKDFCPAGIDIPALVLAVRRRVTREEGLPLLQRAALDIVRDRRLFHAVLRVASKLQRPFESGGYIRHLPFFFSGHGAQRPLPPIADIPFRQRFKRREAPAEKRRAALFAGCLIDMVYPQIAEDVTKVLESAGIEVVFPEAQGCCGAPARYSGAVEIEAECARANIEALLESGADTVVSACPSCAVSLSSYAGLFESRGEAEWAEKARRLAAAVTDFSSLANRLLGAGDLKIAGGSAGIMTYHDSCHLKRTIGVYAQPRELLRAAGHEVNEMANPDACCGMGGSYSLKFPEISARLLERKLASIRAAGSGCVATDCPGCLLQIRGGLAGGESKTAANHTAEIIARALRLG